MRKLFHLWLSPFCRKVRLVLHEKRLEFDMQTESVWDRRPEFLKPNPTGEVPVLVEPEGSAISGSDAICEFIDELHPDPPLIGRTPVVRAEVRRLVYWFDHKFDQEVTEHLIGGQVVTEYVNPEPFRKIE